jgi:Cysteine-rich CPCC
MAIQTESTPQFPCHCCGFLTLSDPATGSYEICPVCFWEDDLVQNEDPEYAGGSNKVSLNAARENYVQFGACEPDFVGDVGPPEIREVPRPTVVPGANDSRPISRRVKIILLGVVRAMLSGAISVLDGCSAIAATAWALNDAQIEEQLRFFIGVAGEVDEFPTRTTRHLFVTRCPCRPRSASRRVFAENREHGHKRLLSRGRLPQS